MNCVITIVEEIVNSSINNLGQIHKGREIASVGTVYEYWSENKINVESEELTGAENIGCLKHLHSVTMRKPSTPLKYQQELTHSPQKFSFEKIIRGSKKHEKELKIVLYKEGGGTKKRSNVITMKSVSWNMNCED